MTPQDKIDAATVRGLLWLGLVPLAVIVASEFSLGAAILMIYCSAMGIAHSIRAMSRVVNDPRNYE